MWGQLWFVNKLSKRNIPKIWKKSWVLFGSYLLNNTANPAHLHSNWAESAVLFSRQLPNGTHDFFQIFRMCFLKDFIKNPQTTNALTFWTHIISGIDGVIWEVSGIQNIPLVERSVDLNLSWLHPLVALHNSQLMNKFFKGLVVSYTRMRFESTQQQKMQFLDPEQPEYKLAANWRQKWKIYLGIRWYRD